MTEATYHICMLLICTGEEITLQKLKSSEQQLNLLINTRLNTNSSKQSMHSLACFRMNYTNIQNIFNMTMRKKYCRDFVSLCVFKVQKFPLQQN